MIIQFKIEARSDIVINSIVNKRRLKTWSTHTCIAINQPYTKWYHNPILNTNSKSNPTLLLSIQLNVGKFPTYPDKLIRDSVVIAPFLLLSVVIVTLPPITLTTPATGHDNVSKFCLCWHKMLVKMEDYRKFTFTAIPQSLSCIQLMFLAINPYMPSFLRPCFWSFFFGGGVLPFTPSSDFLSSLSLSLF